ncbi:hypothetical protein GV828_05440 [Flavobacterium sp. NST-5]|uniref:Lipoprotein n=1 Tax=Flavobacterium ichthyis TaxID=2698827 RepID=A0ABW9Z7U1_9FLAO|nr:hypothetical protein [Flavobacterium ichthyis]NBL64642.1 hypothetical protein [Flavobacterium ichthyis]
MPAKQKILFLFLAIASIALNGCRQPEKALSEDQLLQDELKKINFNQVDEFPSVAACDSLENLESRKQCFFDFLTLTLQEKLDIDKISVLYPEIDTIQVKVTVFPDATLQFEPQFPSDSLTYNKIRIDSILHARLADFPKINPALKRGIPVKTQFILPVILNVE